MPSAAANGIRIEYEEDGPAHGIPFVMVHGLGAQLNGWPPSLLTSLVANGYRVIRFDNRDSGKSTLLKEHGDPDVIAMMKRLAAGASVPAPPYTMETMADDVAGLLDALRIEKAFVLGMSMGSIITQMLALRHSQRIIGAICMASTTGNPKLPGPRPAVAEVLMNVPADPYDKARITEKQMKVFEAAQGSRYRPSSEWVRRRISEAFDRFHDPAANHRQVWAILHSGDRTALLRNITVPMLVIHGTDDGMVPIECGRATHAAIPGSKMVEIEGLGHFLTEPASGDVAAIILEFAASLAPARAAAG